MKVKILLLLLLTQLVNKVTYCQQLSPDNQHIIVSQQKINHLLQIAEQSEVNSLYFEAYEKLVSAADLAFKTNLHQYATEIYVRALNIRLKYYEIFPENYPDKNIPFLKLCRLLQQSLTNEAVFWHEQALIHCEMDKDVECKLDAITSFALYYTNIGKDKKAIQLIERVIPIAKEYSDTLKYAKILLDYSDLLNKLGSNDQALAIANEGYELIVTYEKGIDLEEYRWSYFFLELKGFIYHTIRNYPKAEHYYKACLDSVYAMRNRGGNLHTDLEYVTAIRYGKLHFETENPKLANQFYDLALNIRLQPENQHFNARLLYETMIESFTLTGEYQRAHEASEAYRKFIYTSYVSAINQQNQSQRDLAVLNIQNAQKEISLLKQEADRAIKNNQILLLSIGLLAVILVAGTLIVVNRQTSKNNQSLRAKNQLIIEQKNQITSSIEYAEKIQTALLPSRDIMLEAFPESFVFYLPRDIVSGDFYWVHPIEDGVLLACADCTGHGVPGAIVSMLGNNGLNNCVNDYKLKTPHQILNRLNDFIEKTFSKSQETIYDGMDIALIAYHPKEKIIKYSGANIPLYIVRNQEIIILKPDKQPIGKFDHHKPFTEQSIQVQAGDMVYLLSDGLQDQFGGALNKKFKISRLKKLLLNMAVMPPLDQLETLSMSFFDWKGSQEQVDDLCFIGIKIS